MAAENTQHDNRIERLIAYMAMGTVLLSVICFVAVIWGTAAGMAQADFQQGLWPIVGAIPLFALPLAFLLIILLIILVGIRRSREARGNADH